MHETVCGVHNKVMDFQCFKVVLIISGWKIVRGLTEHQAVKSFQGSEIIFCACKRTIKMKQHSALQHCHFLHSCNGKAYKWSWWRSYLSVWGEIINIFRELRGGLGLCGSSCRRREERWGGVRGGAREVKGGGEGDKWPCRQADSVI